MISPLRALLPSYAVSTGDLDELGYQSAQRYVADIEEAGYGMVWIAEVLGREAFTTAQLALAATTTIIVGNGVARALERVPKSAAAAQAALSDGFPGRYVLGLGVSGAVRERGQAPLPFMTSYLNEIDEHHRRWGVPRDILPRVVGAYSPGLTRLAGTRADGLITFLVTPEHTAWARETLGSDSFLAVTQWAVLNGDRDIAREIARHQLVYYLGLPHQQAKLRRLGFDDCDLMPPGSDRLIDALVVHGTPDDIAGALQAHRSAGADQVVISVLGPPGPAKSLHYRQLARGLGLSQA